MLQRRVLYPSSGSLNLHGVCQAALFEMMEDEMSLAEIALMVFVGLAIMMGVLITGFLMAKLVWWFIGATEGRNERS